MDFTRRRLLTATAGAAGAGLLAGCLDGAADGADPGSESGGPVAQSTFFVFGDITAQVAGDAADAELLVPVGQHGHGWEPGPSVREDVHDADLLVHGMTGFQPWVDGIIGDLEADGSDVATVDVSSGVDLLAPGAGHDEEHHDEAHDDHEETHDEADHEEHSESDAHDDEETHSEQTHDDHEGDDHDASHEEDHEGDDHDHGNADPHFWMDPLRVRDAVETVRAALVDVDSENADAYDTNADEFTARLADLHERIESTVAEASTDTVLVAGHDSFQYFADRYDVEVAALTNVSPDDRPSTRDVERAQSIIDEHDLRYVCADPLESQEAAEQLVAETDAEAVLPLTAMPGLTDEWEREDWGYVDVVENVNLPTLERALDV
ncbi:zinc transport system substrate-binding protein [Halomicrobium zhouii]|uniref:Zinc transport system substrate-binding protein n=1 Tax=Halomicrobium zhouii TaxID=767519 RepID=A0A1I6KIU3_9EURY|nr:metal ABC transporter substrate-binding protein [Halomicrobium zhouii]SFR91131.1 zinc transport system substrate-binding protein [Halomicrobium zhouii]